MKIPKLDTVNKNTSYITEQLEGLHKDVKEGLKVLNKSVKALDKEYKETSVGAWRKVPEPTPSEQYPLVSSDIETKLKKLDII